MANRIDGLCAKERIEKAAIRLYLTHGLEATTNRMLAEAAQVSTGSLSNAYHSKETLLYVCFEHITKRRDEFFSEVQKDKDKVLAYCFEIAVVLHMCDHNAVMKELYSEAYSLPMIMEFIKDTFYKKAAVAFKDHLSEWTEHDFYEAEITRMGIMFGYIMESSNPYFTQEHKIKRCLTSILKLYEYDTAEREKIIEKVTNEKIDDYSTRLYAYITDGII